MLTNFSALFTNSSFDFKQFSAKFSPEHKCHEIRNEMFFKTVAIAKDKNTYRFRFVYCFEWLL